MALADVLGAAIVRPVHVGWLDFKTDPVYGWTGPGSFAPSSTGDSDLDGNTFVPTAAAVAISDFVENQGFGKPLQLTFAAGDMEDEEIFQQLVVDQRAWLGRRAKFWLFFLTADESTVLSDFSVMFNGVMIGASLQRQPGQSAVIQITCDYDLQKARRPPTRWIEHGMFYSGDTATSYMNSLGRSANALNPSQPYSPEYYQNNWDRGA